ncbi:MAG: hypothetical protein HQ592_01530 [Planctomycetes bacterium]|nr:hypothetical protein [Planctomycetota bacterium]
MTGAELSFLLGLHGFVLAGALAALYKYGDRTNCLKEILQGNKEVLSQMRRLIANKLGEALLPVFDNPKSIVQSIVLPHSYDEVEISPAGSEAYYDALFDFVEKDSEALADYKTMHISVKAWTRRAKWLSRFVLYLLTWQFLAAVATFLVIRPILPLPGWAIEWSWIPTLFLIGACLINFYGMLRHHDRMLDCRSKYEVY